MKQTRHELRSAVAPKREYLYTRTQSACIERSKPGSRFNIVANNTRYIDFSLDNFATLRSRVRAFPFGTFKGAV